MLLKPSYTTQESEKVIIHHLLFLLSLILFLFQFDDDPDGGVLVGNHIEPRKVFFTKEYFANDPFPSMAIYRPF